MLFGKAVIAFGALFMKFMSYGMGVIAILLVVFACSVSFFDYLLLASYYFFFSRLS
jgi:hypothetical protein